MKKTRRSADIKLCATFIEIEKFQDDKEQPRRQEIVTDTKWTKY